jgi:hypothetical protein
MAFRGDEITARLLINSKTLTPSQTQMFTRMVIAPWHPNVYPANGLFKVAYSLRDGLAISPRDRQRLEEALKWFETNLATPARFNRSKSKGYYRRSNVGLSWFKPSATQHVSNARKLASIVAGYGHVVKEIATDRPGFVIYEDEYQLVAQPFRDLSLTAESEVCALAEK